MKEGERMSDLKVPRMRTVTEIVEYFKKHDPDTKINQWNVRRMLKAGEIPYEKAGTRYLINLDLFIEKMKGA